MIIKLKAGVHAVGEALQHARLHMVHLGLVASQLQRTYHQSSIHTFTLSIDPYIFLRLSTVTLQGQKPQQRNLETHIQATRETKALERVLALTTSQARGILNRSPSHLIWPLLISRSSGSVQGPSRMTKLFTLSLIESTDTMQRKNILDTCIRNRVLSLMTM